MKKRILIMGLPGAGKTTLALELHELLISIGKASSWFNADTVRQQHNDWDFTEAGRVRQSIRMRELADSVEAHYVICDFVAPLPIMRQNFNADYTIWIDTLQQSMYQDTNSIFVPPPKYNFYVSTKDSPKWAREILTHLLFLENNQ